MKLKPCPFCGETPDHDSLLNQGYDDQQWWIECPNNNCNVAPAVSDSCRATAQEQWNTRAIDPLLNEMAEALAKIELIVDEDWDNGQEIGEIARSVLQKYHEQEDINGE